MSVILRCPGCDCWAPMFAWGDDVRCLWCIRWHEDENRKDWADFLAAHNDYVSALR